ncbi:fimbrial protein [Salmonella enterica subsp. enterica serovar Newport]|nr:fimbrial protein [Salmonella enterica subsp. enterica serovar Newport]
MRNKILSAMVAAGMMMYGASAFAAATPTLASATITVHGNVNDSPCDITSGGVSGGNVDINYNEVSKHTITTTASHEHPFTIHLENCVLQDPGMSKLPKVTVSFKSNNKTDASTHSIMNAGNNVGVQITDNNSTTHTPINLASGTGVEVDFPALSSDSLDLKFSTSLIKFNNTSEVNSGSFTATATYTLTYS